MNPTTQETMMPVPPEEVARRIAEWRGLAYQGKQPPVVVYHPPQQPCPWTGCGFRIGGMVFPLEALIAPDLMDQYLRAWWLGPGLVARCPNCQQFVLFDVLRKDAVPDPATVKAPLLPDDWYEKSRGAGRGNR